MANRAFAGQPQPGNHHQMALTDMSELISLDGDTFANQRNSLVEERKGIDDDSGMELRHYATPKFEDFKGLTLNMDHVSQPA